MSVRGVCTVGVGLVFLSFAAHSAEKAFDRTFTVEPGGTLKVNADSSDIVVTGTDGAQVIVHIIASGSQNALDRLNLSAEQSAQGVSVTAKHTGTNWFGLQRMESKITVKVPRRYNVDLRTSGGDLAVEQLEGDAVGATSGGDIRVSDAHGAIGMETSGGNITLARVEGNTKLRSSGGDVVLTAVKGDVDAATSGGDMRLETVDGAVKAHTSGGEIAATTIKGDVNLESSSGDIKALGIDGRIRAHSSGGGINAELVGANRGISATTSGGDITLRTSRNIAAVIDLSTSGGSITSDLPVSATQVSERTLRGAVNGGGEKIYARTSGGNVRLQAN